MLPPVSYKTLKKTSKIHVYCRGRLCDDQWAYSSTCVALIIAAIMHIAVSLHTFGVVPEEHLFEHAVGGGDAGQPPCGEWVELQVGGNDLSGHLCVCSRTCTTTAGQQQISQSFSVSPLPHTDHIRTLHQPSKVYNTTQRNLWAG